MPQRRQSAESRPAVQRRAAIPLICALALAMGGVLLLAASGGASDPALRAGNGASATTPPPPGVALRLRSTAPPAIATDRPEAATPTGSGAMPIPAEPGELADPLAGPVSDAYVQKLLDATTTSAPPALPAATTKAAIRAADRVLVADLTGTGRDQFPGFWSEPPHTAWSRVKVQASSAQTAGLAPARVEVTVIWAGRSPTGDQVERRRTVITVELTANGWWPVSVS